MQRTPHLKGGNNSKTSRMRPGTCEIQHRPIGMRRVALARACKERASAKRMTSLMANCLSHASRRETAPKRHGRTSDIEKASSVTSQEGKPARRRTIRNKEKGQEETMWLTCALSACRRRPFKMRATRLTHPPQQAVADNPGQQLHNNNGWLRNPHPPPPLCTPRLRHDPSGCAVANPPTR